MTYFHSVAMQPSSSVALWSGSPSHFASVSTDGRIARAAYTLTEDALQFDADTVTALAQSIPLVVIVDLDVHHTLTQRARRPGDLTLRLHPALADRYGRERLTLTSTKDPLTVKDRILKQANQVRAYWTDLPRQQTVGQRSAGAAQREAASVAAPAAGDLMSRLRELAGMKAAGILSEDEFTAAKARLLAGA